MRGSGSLGVGLWALSLVTAVALDEAIAVADTESASGMAAQAEDAGVGDGGLASGDAAVLVVEGPAEDVAEGVTDDGSAEQPTTFAEAAPFGDPGWTYTVPTYELCFPDPFVLDSVDGVTSPEGTPCDVD